MCGSPINLGRRGYPGVRLLGSERVKGVGTWPATRLDPPHTSFCLLQWWICLCNTRTFCDLTLLIIGHDNQKVAGIGQSYSIIATAVNAVRWPCYIKCNLWETNSPAWCVVPVKGGGGGGGGRGPLEGGGWGVRDPMWKGRGYHLGVNILGSGTEHSGY